MATDDRVFASRAVERVVFLSDAVVAIAITLLAIDLPVPTGSTMSAFLSSVRNDADHYFAFLISFALVAAAWSHHHDMFHYVIDVDARLRQLNLAWLFTVVLIPFAARLLIIRGQETAPVHAVRFGFYALLQVTSQLVLLAMLRHLDRRQFAPNTPRQTITNLTLESAGLAIGFGLSVPLFFLVSWAWAFWLLFPAAFNRFVAIRRAAAKRRDDSTGASVGQH